MPMAMNWARASPLAQVRIASAVRSSVKCMRSSGAVRPRMRSFFNLSFLSGGERVPLTFVGHPLGTDKQITVQAKVVLPANKSGDVHMRVPTQVSLCPAMYPLLLLTPVKQVGNTLLQVAREYDIEVEGACEGQLACSTWCSIRPASHAVPA